MSTETNANSLFKPAVSFEMKDGIYVVLESDFKKKLDSFLARFEEIRVVEGKKILDQSCYKELPFGKLSENNFDWKFRQSSLSAIETILQTRTEQRILEIGAWNGWLSNRLALNGHKVVAVDFFADEFDGLKSKKHYATDWESVQMNVLEIDIFAEPFDVIVLNHCMQFIPEPFSYLENLKKMLRPDGIIIFLGLTFYQNPIKKRTEIANFKAHYLNKHNFEIFLHSNKAHFDGTDYQTFLKLGIVLKMYPKLWLKNTISKLLTYKPTCYYGYWPSN